MSFVLIFQVLRLRWVGLERMAVEPRHQEAGEGEEQHHANMAGLGVAPDQAEVSGMCKDDDHGRRAA